MPEMGEEAVRHEMKIRAGLPPKDDYLARCFHALMQMVSSHGDHRSAPQLIEALKNLQSAGALTDKSK